MDLFIHIFITTIIPIFALIAVGVILDRKFSLDLDTLSKLNFYLLLPAYVFRSLYRTEFEKSSIEIIFCSVLILILNSLLASSINKFTKFDAPKREILRNSVMFNNAGNIGVAVATFIFSNAPYIVNGQTPYLHTAIVSVISLFIVQNVSSNTLGFYQAGIGKMTARDALRLVFHMPIIYIPPITFFCKYVIPFDLTEFFLWPVFDFFGSAFVANAMVTLGAQINRTPLNFFKFDVMVATFARLVLGPITALIAVLAFTYLYNPFHPITAQAIIIIYSVPTAINTALIALEMRNNPEFATQIIMATTILSGVTMPLAVMLAYYTFPLY